MLIDIDIHKLNSAITDFYNSTGVSISILREDLSLLASRRSGNPYCRIVQGCKQGLIKCLDSNRALLEKCRESRKAELQVCHAGMTEVAIPILYGESVIGYVMLGHFRMETEGADTAARISELPIDPCAAASALESSPSFDRTRVESIVSLASMFVRYIMVENLLKPREDGIADGIRSFVLSNLDKRLTAAVIAKGVHISKSTLYSTVRTCFGCTVSEYINQIKIERSKEMLANTDMTIEDIAERLGFSSPAYYSKVFKRTAGRSPLKFRKSSEEGSAGR